VHTSLVIITENKNVKCPAWISIVSNTKQNHLLSRKLMRNLQEKNKMSKIRKVYKLLVRSLMTNSVKPFTWLDLLKTGPSAGTYWTWWRAIRIHSTKKFHLATFTQNTTCLKQLLRKHSGTAYITSLSTTETHHIHSVKNLTGWPLYCKSRPT